MTYAQALLDHDFGRKDDQWWYEYDAGWLSHCNELAILMLHGWAESEGVRIEIEAAKALGIWISHLEVPGQFAGLTPAQSKELYLRLLS